MPITNYGQYMDEVTGKGKLAEYAEHKADTAGSADRIDWGVAVEYAENPDQVTTFAGGTFRGVALANHYAEYYVSDVSNDDVDGYYEAGEPVSYLKKGVVWVEVTSDVTKGDAAYPVTGSGNFRATIATDTTTEDGTAVGYFKSSAQAGGFAKLEINLP